ncbi:MAG: ATP synthase F1 subunit gamma [Bacteroidales bacterium]|nr:ATP synthase F1 subunit gamma [Bacteroidales bacterium]
MANLKEIRSRIASVTSTRQITSAMKMVAAAKLRKAQNFVSKIVPYKNKMQEVLAVLSETLAESSDNIYTTKREVKNMLVVAVSSNKGLCGGFNSNVFKYCVQIAEREKAKNPGVNIQFYTIGRKIGELLHKAGYNVYKTNMEAVDSVDYQKSADIAQEVTDLFKEGKIDDVRLVFNEFVNPAVQYVGESNFLPLKFDTGKQKFKSDYIFEPGKDKIVDSLIPQWLKLTVFSSLAESFAGEQGARMTSMNKATDNATELIKELNLQYNKVRQASITNEIIEIVSGANAN